MALLDFLKNKKEADKAKEVKSEKVSAAKKSETKAEKPLGRKSMGEVKAEKKSASKNEGKFSYSVVKEPHISEKGTILAESNQYVFRVYANANKPEIKKSVEGIYNVNVLNVNIVTIPKKKRRLGRTEGFKKGYKKAIVTVKEGQKIEVY